MTIDVTLGGLCGLLEAEGLGDGMTSRLQVMALGADLAMETDEVIVDYLAALYVADAGELERYSQVGAHWRRLRRAAQAFAADRPGAPPRASTLEALQLGSDLGRRNGGSERRPPVARIRRVTGALLGALKVLLAPRRWFSAATWFFVTLTFVLILELNPNLGRVVQEGLKGRLPELPPARSADAAPRGPPAEIPPDHSAEPAIDLTVAIRLLAARIQMSANGHDGAPTLRELVRDVGTIRSVDDARSLTGLPIDRPLALSDPRTLAAVLRLGNAPAFEYFRTDGGPRPAPTADETAQAALDIASIATLRPAARAEAYLAPAERFHRSAPLSPVETVAISRDGSHLAIATDQDVTVYSPEGRRVKRFAASRPKSIAFTPDGRHLVASDGDRRAELFDLDGPGRSIARLPEGQFVLAVSARGDATAVTTGTTIALLGRTPRVIQTGDATVAAFAEDAPVLALAPGGSNAELVSLDPGGDQVTWLSWPRHTIIRIAISPDGGRVALAASTGAISIQNRSGVERRRFVGQLRDVDDLSFSGDGAHLAAAGDGGVVVWDLNSGDAVLSLTDVEPSGNNAFVAVRLAYDGGRVLVARRDGSVRLLEARDPIIEVADKTALKPWTVHELAAWATGRDQGTSERAAPPSAEAIARAAEAHAFKMGRSIALTDAPWRIDPPPARPAPAPWFLSHVGLTLEVFVASILIWIIAAWRQRHVLARGWAVPKARLIDLFAEDRKLGAAPDPGLRRAARRLLERQTVGARFDIRRSIRATVRSGGVFTPIETAITQPPEYVVFVDSASRDDQQTYRILEQLKGLVAEKVPLIWFLFERAPDRARSGVGQPMRALELLAAEHSQRRLILVGDAAQMEGPGDPTASRWLRTLEAWRSRLILTTVPSAQWGRPERRLAEAAGANLAAYSIASLTQAPLSIDGGALGEVIPPQKATSAAPYLLRLDPDRWLLAMEPTEPELSQLMTALYRYLGAGGMRWLCACAFYPVIDWDLTVALGRRLKDFEGRALYSEAAAARLAELPWMRAGRMPEWVQRALVEHLTPADLAILQDEMSEVLEGLRPLSTPDPDAVRLGFKTSLAEGRSARLDERFVELVTRPSPSRSRSSLEATRKLRARLRPSFLRVMFSIRPAAYLLAGLFYAGSVYALTWGAETRAQVSGGWVAPAVLVLAPFAVLLAQRLPRYVRGIRRLIRSIPKSGRASASLAEFAAFQILTLTRGRARAGRFARDRKLNLVRAYHDVIGFWATTTLIVWGSALLIILVLVSGAALLASLFHAPAWLPWVAQPPFVVIMAAILLAVALQGWAAICRTGVRLGSNLANIAAGYAGDMRRPPPAMLTMVAVCVGAIALVVGGGGAMAVQASAGGGDLTDLFRSVRVMALSWGLIAPVMLFVNLAMFALYRRSVQWSRRGLGPLSSRLIVAGQARSSWRGALDLEAEGFLTTWRGPIALPAPRRFAHAPVLWYGPWSGEWRRHLIVEAEHAFLGNAEGEAQVSELAELGRRRARSALAAQPTQAARMRASPETSFENWRVDEPHHPHLCRILWGTETGLSQAHPAQPPMAAANDGRVLAALGTGVQLWTPVHREYGATAILRAPAGEVCGISPDGLSAIVRGVGVVEVWDLVSGELRHRRQSHMTRPMATYFDRGRHLLFATRENAFAVVEMATGAVVHELNEPGLAGVSAARDVPILALMSADARPERTLSILEVGQQEPVVQQHIVPSRTSCVIGPAGDRFAIYGERTVTLHDLSGEIVFQAVGGGPQQVAPLLTADGRLFCQSPARDVLDIWDCDLKRRITSMNGLMMEGPRTTLATSARGDVLVAGTNSFVRIRRPRRTQEENS